MPLSLQLEDTDNRWLSNDCAIFIDFDAQETVLEKHFIHVVIDRSSFFERLRGWTGW